MNDITEYLRLYKELKPVWEKYLLREWAGIINDEAIENYPTQNDLRLQQFHEVATKLSEYALHSDAVVITDTTLHRVFFDIRLGALDESMDDDGFIFSDDLYDHLAFRYSPHDIAKNLATTKPLVTLNELPVEVNALIGETREAFCLGLPTACVSLCRSLVERAIVDIAFRTGRIDKERLGDMGMCDRISLLLDKSVSRSSPLRQEINAFMAVTSDVIHSNATADMTSAREVFADAQLLTQKLYGHYKAQLKNYV